MSSELTTDTPDGGGPDGSANGSGDDGGGRPRVAPFVVGIVAIVIAGLFWVLSGADASPQGETADTPLLNRPAPDAVGQFEDGSTFDLARRKGSWVVINFFQSSCVPCIQEHPELIEFVDEQRRLRRQGADYAEFYTIVYDDDRKSVNKFFEQRGGDWPVVYDPDGSISVAFGVSKVPETWIISPDGFVRERIISRVQADTLTSAIQAMREAGL